MEWSSHVPVVCFQIYFRILCHRLVGIATGAPTSVGRDRDGSFYLFYNSIRKAFSSYLQFIDRHCRSVCSPWGDRALREKSLGFDGLFNAFYRIRGSGINCIKGHDSPLTFQRQIGHDFPLTFDQKIFLRWLLKIFHEFFGLQIIHPLGLTF